MVEPTDHSRGPASFVEFGSGDIEQSVPARFEQQVRRFPNRLALKHAQETLTYDALNQTANRIARAIVARRGDTEEPVALLFGHGVAMVPAVLGALKAGKVAVPLEPAQPLSRLAAILEDSEASVIVTETPRLPVAESLLREGRSLLNTDDIDDTFSPADLGLPLSPGRLVQIMYTSGSTGHPKGVVQNHRNFLHAVMRYTNPPRVVPDDRVASLLSYARVAGMLQIFRALLNGAAVFPFDLQEHGFARLIDWLAREEITILHTVPSVFRQLGHLLTGKERFPHLRLIHLGGELASRHDVELYRRHFAAGCVLLNNFGATETATVREYFIDKTTEIAGNIVPVGYPVADVEVLLLDGDGKEVGPDQVGEIAVKSRYVALGYWRRPDLTRERFRPAPEGERIYLTGDVGRMQADGCLVHLGRGDSQVKIRGNLIEIAELEMALLEDPGVAAAAVAVKDIEPGGPSLIAYLVPHRGATPRADDLRMRLKRTVPDFMMPSGFVFVDTLPRTSEGKVDRPALAALPTVRPAPGVQRVPPIEAVECQLAQIWEDMLKIRGIGMHDDFFELGGHSLLALRMMDHIERVFGRRLPLHTLCAGATIEHLTNALLSRETRESASLLVKVQSGGPDRPFFFVRSALDGSDDYCLKLARGLGRDRPFYVLAPHGQDGRPVPAAIEGRAASYVGMIREVQPQGPYYLGGLCEGAVLAFEVARELQGSGEEVALVVLVAAPGQPWLGQLRRAFHGIAARVRWELAPAGQWRGLAARAVGSRQRRVHLPTQIRRLFGAPLVGGSHSSGNQGPTASPVSERGDEISSESTLRRDPLARARAISEEEVGGAVARYAPGPYRGRLLLVWPHDETAKTPRDPTRGWGRIAPELALHIVPRDQSTPGAAHVGAVARLVGAALRDFQEPACPSEPAAERRT
jgi:amino acid adenylation domain-containing protein